MWRWHVCMPQREHKLQGGIYSRPKAPRQLPTPIPHNARQSLPPAPAPQHPHAQRTFFTLSSTNTFSSGSLSTVPARPRSAKNASLMWRAHSESCLCTRAGGVGAACSVGERLQSRGAACCCTAVGQGRGLRQQCMHIQYAQPQQLRHRACHTCMPMHAASCTALR